MKHTFFQSQCLVIWANVWQIVVVNEAGYAVICCPRIYERMCRHIKYTQGVQAMEWSKIYVLLSHLIINQLFCGYMVNKRAYNV